jgi:glycosyltransferase involved in cell wall biosynthesis
LLNNEDKYIELKHNRKSFFKSFVKRWGLKFVFFIEKLILNEPIPKTGIVGVFWSIKAAKQIKKIIKKENIDSIIISAPPFSFLLTGYFLKIKFKEIKLFIDYRDPWNLWGGGSFISNYIEKRIIAKSDHVIVTTDNMRDGLMREFNVNKDKISVVYNGFSEMEWNKVNSSQNTLIEKLTISFVGSISMKKGSFRDTTNFFKAYDVVREEDKFKMKFIGISFDEDINKLIKKYPEIDFIEKVTPVESFQYMLDSNVLMNIHTAQDNSAHYLIGGKIYDYLKSNRLIFSINSKNSFEQFFLNKIGSDAIFSENNVEDILQSFKSIENYFKISPRKKLNTEDLSIYSREYQNNSYINLINDFNKN